MADVDREVLEQVLAGSIEPLVIVRTDQPDWPIVLANPAFFAIGGEDVVGPPFADVIVNWIVSSFRVAPRALGE